MSTLIDRVHIDYNDIPVTVPDIIIEEAGRLNDIISDFLNFARPKNPNLLQCKVEDILEKNLKFLSVQIKENAYEIEKQYDNDLPDIMADPDMLYQAFLNVLINSIQAMPEGGKLIIEICAEQDSVFIKFKDEGKGISDKEFEKIWDPFFTTKETGTGLGLGIVKNIIKSHGGSISIVNRQLRGVCVSIEIPAIP